MISLASIYAGGVITLIVAVFHTRFYKIFRWKAEFSKITGLNKRIFFTIHFALLLMLFIFGLLSIIFVRELSNSNGIALGINVMISVFWLWRAIWQIFYFKGAFLHYLLIFTFFLLTIAYSLPVLMHII